MKRILLLFTLVSFIHGGLLSQNTDYSGKWREIFSLMEMAHNKSALDEAVKVYKHAMSNGDYIAAVRAIIYRTANQIDLYGEQAAIDSLKQEPELLPQPAKSIIYAMMGSIYKKYYTAVKWQTGSRTRTAVADSDMETWDITRLFEETLKCYKLSIQDEETLKRTPLDDYREIVNYEINHTLKRIVFPTLYDFLTFSTIRTFREEASVVLPQQSFVPDRPEYFADVNTFVNYRIETPDSLSAEYNVINMYQKLLKFRLEENSSDAALLSIDIERLKYVYEKGRYNNGYVMYENALKSLMDAYAGTAERAYAAYALALLYGEQYFEENLPDKFRHRPEEAVDLCTEIIERYANSAGVNTIVESAKILKEKLCQPSVRIISIMQLQYPDSPMMALVKYVNTDRVYLRIYSVDREYYMNGDYSGALESLKNRKPVATKEIAVPLKGDYRQHSAEIMIDGLPQGFYVITASVPGYPDRDSGVACSVIQVSPLDIASRGSETDEIYVANAKTGMPEKNASVEFYYHNDSIHISQTDENGIATIPRKDRERGLKRIIINSASGHLYVKGMYFFNYSKASRQAVFFTDRSIYRPGQTVYYKVLYLNMNTDAKERYSLAKNENINVDFRDANNKVIESRRHTTGEYGSAAGSFTVPQGLLNGEMRLSSEYGNGYIRVEEYKRPTFEVKFDPIGRNYRLNDSLRLSGKAQALAGYAVDNAKVQYRVVREMRYRAYYWRLPQITVPFREIASGTVTTDRDGAFEIDFKAEDEDSDVRNDNLIYGYKVTADVTDLNGETHSAKLSVNMGSKNLRADIQIPARIVNRDSLNFRVTTTNLNGEFTPADLQVTLTALKLPEGILRPRLLEMPDTFAMSRKEFKRYFPLDPYGDEGRPEKFETGKQLASYTSKTASRNHKISLATLAKAPSGWYRVDIKAKDGEGTEVEYENFVQLTGAPVSKTSKKPVPPFISSMSDWLTVTKDSGNPGEYAGFWLGGTGKKSYICCDIIHKSRVVERKIIIADAPKHILIPIKEEYRGGFTVQFLMIQDGRIYTKPCNINVPYTNKRLDITFTTFRNMLLPGEKEKWTLKIKNANGEKETAEMVATLYDASLDAFISHGWYNGFYQQNYSFANWNPYEQYPTNYRIYGKYYEINSKIFSYPYMHFMDERGNFQIRGIWTRGIWDKMTLDEATIVPFSIQKKESKIETITTVSHFSEPVSSEIAFSLPDIATRQNFNETAFFYPQLRTDENGEISIEFTIPEALTRWKMLG
ncbi:MAG: hypothetical protein LBK96_04300, partial [Prevotellaceae bacterium]|nr:hypothetical protein [Prevotellaceae bacterium]